MNISNVIYKQIFWMVENMTNEIICIDNITVVIHRKKVKNINLRIGKDKTITISANNRISIKSLEKLITSKKDWINYNLNRIDIHQTQNEKSESIEYVSGEEIKLQGNQYKLLVLENKKNHVEIEENVIYLYTSDISSYKEKKKIIDKLIKCKAEEFFEESLMNMLDLISIYGVKRPEMKIRKMRSRWGSCNKTKKLITINFELVKAPKDCLDYVVLHELIHFLVSGHNKTFYNYMSILMPDWKIRKKMLNDQHLL
jgi:predicted metal-dependent hydrolase